MKKRNREREVLAAWQAAIADVCTFYQEQHLKGLLHRWYPDDHTIVHFQRPLRHRLYCGKPSVGSVKPESLAGAEFCRRCEQRVALLFAAVRERAQMQASLLDSEISAHLLDTVRQARLWRLAIEQEEKLNEYQETPASTGRSRSMH